VLIYVSLFSENSLKSYILDERHDYTHTVLCV